MRIWQSNQCRVRWFWWASYTQGNRPNLQQNGERRRLVVRVMKCLDMRLWCSNCCLHHSVMLERLPPPFCDVQTAASTLLWCSNCCLRPSPQWGTADAEIKVPSLENPELADVLPLKHAHVYSRSEYSHACFAHCQEFLPCPNFYKHAYIYSRSEYSPVCFTHCQEFLPCPNFYKHACMYCIYIYIYIYII